MEESGRGKLDAPEAESQKSPFTLVRRAVKRVSYVQYIYLSSIGWFCHIVRIDLISACLKYITINYCM